MLTTAKVVLKMQPIREFRREPDGVFIILHDGTIARLNLNHPHFGDLMISVESDLRRRRPVGLLMDVSGQIVDLGAAHDTPVRSIVPFASDSSQFAVGFWAYSPVCGLTRDQPEFERIFATLTEAVRTSRMVWVTTHSRDVVEGTPDEDGLIPAYPRIMDVRTDSLTGSLVNGIV